MAKQVGPARGKPTTSLAFEAGLPPFVPRGIWGARGIDAHWERPPWNASRVPLAWGERRQGGAKDNSPLSACPIRSEAGRLALGLVDAAGEVVEDGILTKLPDPLVVVGDDEVAAGQEALDLPLAQQVPGGRRECRLVETT